MRKGPPIDLVKVPGRPRCLQLKKGANDVPVSVILILLSYSLRSKADAMHGGDRSLNFVHRTHAGRQGHRIAPIQDRTMFATAAHARFFASISGGLLSSVSV